MGEYDAPDRMTLWDWAIVLGVIAAITLVLFLAGPN
jgi:hypothetical protein